jgi:hypothetical protein
MDKGYADTVRLLLAVAPEVFANDIFAMKGGTSNQPLRAGHAPPLGGYRCRVSPWQVPREESLAAIERELTAVSRRLAPLGVQTRRSQPGRRGYQADR